MKGLSRSLFKPLLTILVASSLLMAWHSRAEEPGEGEEEDIFELEDPPAYLEGSLITTTSPSNIVASGGQSSPQSSVANQWEGMFQTSSIRPPDPHGAAGPNGIIQTVNLRIAYYTKAGSVIWGPVDLDTFWSSVGNTGSGNSDPRAVYDPASGRFYVILQEATPTQAYLNLAVSKNSHPATSGTSDWYFYRLNVTETVGSARYGNDYPGLGVDGQAVYVTYNMYSLPFASSGIFRNCQIVVLNKSAINSGTGTYRQVFSPNGASSAFTLQPASVLGSGNPGNVAYFVETPLYTSTAVRIWALTNPLGSGSLTSTTVTIPSNGGIPSANAPQAGTSITVDTLAPRTQGNAFYYNGALWFCHTAGGGAGKSIVYYYKVNANNYPSGTPTLAESGGLDGGSGVWTYQPAIGGNANGDVCIVFTQSSSSSYPTIMYTSRSAAAASFDVPSVLKASPGYSNSDRWGDYATVSADPADSSFWISHEWAKSTALHNWSTWWGQIFPSANLPPSVSITNPGNGASFNAPANITISASASDSDGTVAQVQFFANSTLLGTDTSSPFSFNWNNVSPGNYTLTARATDNGGAVTTSAGVDISVNQPNNQPPSVALTSPSNGASYVAPANLSLDASASDSDGTVAQVQFFANSTLLATDTSAPYHFSWNSVPAGNYALTARATDNAGATTTSSTVNISVTSSSSQSPFITSVNLGQIRNDYSGWLGMRFTVGASPVNVVSLGRIFLSGNSGVHTLKLVDASNGSDVPNGAVSLTAAGGTVGQFLYTALPSPVTLSANHTYYLVSQETLGGDSWAYWDTSVSTASVGTCDGAVYGSGGYNLHAGVNSPLGPVNFLFGSGTANQPPSVSVTSPSNGATFTASANITINASASDSDGTVAQVQFFANGSLLGTDTSAPFSFAWNNVVAGNYSLTARATDNSGASTTSTGVNISVNSPANQPPTVSISSPANGATFTAPANITVNASASDSDGTVAQVQFFANSTSLGTDTTAPYSVSWNSVPAGSYTLTARATDNAGATTTSTGINITVNPAGGGQSPFVTGVNIGTVRNDFAGWLGMKFTVGPNPLTVVALGRYDVSGSGGNHNLKLVNASNGANVPNGAVTVNLSSGAPGQFVYANLSASVTLSANTSYYLVSQESSGGDSWGHWDSSVTTANVGTCNGAVYSFDGSTYGEHLGANSPLGPVSFLFASGSGNQPPSVSVTSPGNGASFTAPANITINASASDSDGTVSQVQFLANGSLLGTDTTSPFSFAWNNVPAGSYTLTARATDNSGASTTSSGVNINVNSAANQPPAVAITSPGNGAAFTAPASVTINASANDTDGTVSQVQFFANGSLLGTDTTAPYSFTWNNVAAGGYTLTARATDNSGASTTSSGVNITVNPGSSSSPFVTSVNIGTVRNVYTGWLGMKFTVGSAPLTVTALGRIYLSGNNGSHVLKLVNASTEVDVPGGSVTVSLGSGTVGQFVYANLSSSVVLSANTTYYLVSQEVDGGDSWGHWDNSVSTSSAGACNGAVYSSDGNTYGEHSGANSPLGPVSFLYQ